MSSASSAYHGGAEKIGEDNDLSGVMPQLLRQQSSRRSIGRERRPTFDQDLEDAQEDTPLLTRTKSRQATQSRTLQRTLKEERTKMRQKDHQLTALDNLQEPSYVEAHFPLLDTDQVVEAAIDLQRVVELGDSCEPIPARREYYSAIMFNRHPVQTCTLLHFAIWFVAEHNGSTEIITDVLKALDKPDDALWPATFAKKSQLFFVNATHIAASFGQLPILVALFSHVAENMSEEKRLDRESFACQWARVLPLTTTCEEYMDLQEEGVDAADPSTLFNQPLHDSTLASQSQVTLWLLRQQADPCAKNHRGITPLHFVALAGIGSGGVGSSQGEDLSRIVKALQRTGKAVGAKADMSGFFYGDEAMKNVTPLYVATQDASRFPQDYLGLLAPCLNDSKKSLTYFTDIKEIAEVTAEGALNLVQTIRDKGQENQHTLRRFRMNAQMEGASDQLASILYTAPLAASEMLDLLEVDPAVEDASHYPLTAKTSMWGLLQNVEMRCSYQTDAVKREGLMIPLWIYVNKPGRDEKGMRTSSKEEIKHEHYWHKDFAPKWKRQNRASHAKHVKIVAALMPGILDIDVFMALAHCDKEHIAIMNKKTIQGAVCCLWDNLVKKVAAVRGFFDFLDMVAYITVSGLIHADMHYGSLCFPIIAAGNFHNVLLVILHNISLIRKWSETGGDATMAELWSPVSTWNISYTVPMTMQAMLGTCFVVDYYLKGASGEARTQFDDILLAALLLLSCFRFIWMSRLSVLGSRLYSIRETFCAPAVNQMLFITFLLLFSFITALMVLCRMHTVNLTLLAYRGFLFGDGDGFNGIGMDAKDPATATNNGTLIAYVVFGSFFFNVIVLNIIIAIYGNTYDNVQRQRGEFFMMGRADYCVKTVLSTYVISWRGELFNASLTTVALAAIGAGVVMGKFANSIFMSAMLLAFGEVLLPMAMIQCSWFSPEGHDSEDRQRYLWMCHSQGWKAGEEKDDLREELQEEIDSSLLDVDEKVALLDGKMEQLLTMLGESGVSATAPGTTASPTRQPKQVRISSKLSIS